MPLLEFPAAWANRPAFASDMGQLTFAQMREGTLRFCRLLRERFDIGPGTRVALCLPKSLEAMQVIWGILAAGAAYVPLQFQGPPTRLNSILRSVEPHLLVTIAQMANQLVADGTWPTLPICCLAPAEAGQGLATLLLGIAPETSLLPNGADGLAAIYFTSGSTGEPKGVMLSHANIAASVNLVVNWDALCEQDRLVSHSNLHYATYDMFFPFAVGCRTFLVSNRDAMLPAGIAVALERERATVWRTTVTALRLLLESGELGSCNLSALRLLGFIGEPLPIPLLRRFMAALPKCRFTFNYGATEAYRIASFDIPPELPDDLISLPIGLGREEYVLSLRGEEDQEVEDGEVGELCVEGDPVMLGYWKDPQMSARRRLPGRPRSWRTGDLGYRDASGLLYLVGRKDQMVKIRGHRFDLGEIEAVLRSQPGVRDAFAVLSTNSKVHVAVLAEPNEVLKAAVRRGCAKSLPVFARPSRVLFFEEFPTLPTGKVDRLALRARLAESEEGTAGVTVR
jgi:amino acid adenylation domain-containing protein